MTSKNIGWHSRLYSDNSVKVTGGSFGGELSLETANRLTRAHCAKVIVKPSGTAVFVDKQNREIRIYISVDPDSTDMGKAAISEWRKEKEKREREEQQTREIEAAEIESLMSGLSPNEVIKRLKGMS